MEMLQCNSINYTNTCQLYPAIKYGCSQFLGNKYIYNEFGISEYFDHINREIDSINIILTSLIVPNSICSHLFITLICNAVFPRCLPSSTNNVKKQKLCKETCNSMSKNLCKTFLPVLIGYFKNEKWRLDEKVSKTVMSLFNCLDYPSKYNENDPECFSVVGKYIMFHFLSPFFVTILCNHSMQLFLVTVVVTISYLFSEKYKTNKQTNKKITKFIGGWPTG